MPAHQHVTCLPPPPSAAITCSARPLSHGFGMNLKLHASQSLCSHTL